MAQARRIGKGLALVEKKPSGDFAPEGLNPPLPIVMGGGDQKLLRVFQRRDDFRALGVFQNAA